MFADGGTQLLVEPSAGQTTVQEDRLRFAPGPGLPPGPERTRRPRDGARRHLRRKLTERTSKALSKSAPGLERHREVRVRRMEVGVQMVGSNKLLKHQELEFGPLKFGSLGFLSR